MNSGHNFNQDKRSEKRSTIKKEKSLLKKSFTVFWIFLLTLFVISLYQVILLNWINPVTSSIMIQRYFIPKTDLKKSIEYDWYNIENISKNMPLAVIAAEDQNYPFHFGFDFEQINKALDEIEKGIRVRGASTITQQTAKNLFLWEGKSFIRKGLEAYYAFLMEFFMTKERIIEIYLNIAETGNNIFGAGTASRIYFNKPPSKLTKGESALIAAVLPNPYRFSVTHPSGYTLRRKQWILNQMDQLGGIGYLNNL